MIPANNAVQDALTLIDVVAPGEPADPWFAQIAVRLLNGMLGEWSAQGIYSPKQGIYEFAPTISSQPYYTLGTEELRTLSNTKLAIVATADVAGTYYRSVDGTVTAYKTTGLGTKYSLVVTEDTAGTFYAINGGYSEKRVGDISTNFAQIQSVQVDLGTVVYNPKQVTLEEYMSLSVKQTTAPPAVWACDYQQPMAKLYFWPRLQGNLTLRVVGSALIDPIANNQDQINLDMQWYNGIVYNLACRLYPVLKRDGGLDREIIYMAKKAIIGLRSLSVVRRSAHVVVPYGGGTNRSGDYWLSPLNTCTGP